jgi:hypothetical protein
MKGSFMTLSATKAPFITATVTKDPFIAPPARSGSTHSRAQAQTTSRAQSPHHEPGASPHHPRAACHPVDLAKPNHAVSRACEKHEITKVMALDAV